MKKVLGIIALAALVACTEKPASVTHPELEDVDLWSCIDQMENNYILLNVSGEDFPAITRYAWADIDGDGLAELFLASQEEVFPEISAAFTLGDKEPACVGYADPSHSMYFYREGVSTLGTGVTRYNFRDQRDRIKDSKLLWELAIEETEEIYADEEEDMDFSETTMWFPGSNEVQYPDEEDVQAHLAEFTDQIEIVLDWQPLGLYQMETLQTPAGSIQYNAKRFEVKKQETVGEDFDGILQNINNPLEWLRFTSYYDDNLDVLQENDNKELIAQHLQGTCEENSLNVTEDSDYTVFDSYLSSMEYFNPENGYFFHYEASVKGEQVYGVICVSPCEGGKVMVMRAESPSQVSCERLQEQFSSLSFTR